ncbi:MAG: glycosyl hydrolase [Verrucomicrobia bacterium]|nr:glycosyl hydrolase [Verrucomicrobiota bacterium]
MKTSLRKRAAALAAAVGLTIVPFDCTAAGSELERGFRAPPVSARPWVYWMWMDGNLSREGITADLEAMQRAGLGGVIIMEVDVGIPRGPVKFMSPEWRALFKHVVEEAERLGLQITLNAGPGWTGSGGPWVKPEQSMQHLVASETNVAGPRHFNEGLHKPAPRKPFFGEGALPPEHEKARKEFYRDVAVLAFPTPSGDERIADIDEKALYVRAPYSSQPGVKPFLATTAEHPAVPAGAAVESARIVDLSDRLASDGRLEWDVPEGRWTILRFGRTSTGANTRPAPAPGLGLESDKFDKAALDAHFEQFVGALLRELGPRRKSAGAGWTSLHIDSWEMGAQNWTAAFRDEFRRRRGYDLLHYLPALTGRVVESREVSERFLWDLRQTAQELVIENHAQHLKALGRRHGFGLSIEPYDMNPCADLSLGGVADVPMCEFWLHGFDTTYSVIEAASIAHTLGRRIVAAEAFTSDDSERWRAHPATMKALGDWAFCAGVNRIVFHRYQHQPWLDRWPGMTMGPYGVHWERTQTWWDMVPAYHEYLARCQFMLRRGLPVADALYLAAEGAPHVFRPPSSATRGNPPDRLGYNFDGCAPETLIERVRVKNGKLVLPDGMSYRVLVLPERDTMTPRLLRKVRDLVKAGATVIGPPPVKSPSLSGYPKWDAEVKKLAEELWGSRERSDGVMEKWSDGEDAPAASASTLHHSITPLLQRRVGKGRLLWNPTGKATEPTEQYGDFAVVADTLRRMGMQPDFESDAELRYTHRRDGGTEIYFVANPHGQEVQATATFRVSGEQPELWWPDTGRIKRAAVFEQKVGRTAILLKLDAHGSVFVVFRKPAQARGPTVARANWEELTTLQNIAGQWEVRFAPNRGAPEQLTFDKLLDWSEHTDPRVSHFSGKATYRTTFAWPPRESQIANCKSQIVLDLGRVEVMARVALNGRDLGVVWKPPFRVDLADALKPGANTLEITVANLWPNRLIGDAALPPEKRVAWTTWNPFKPDAPLLGSGLIGPVRLLATREAQPGK